MDRRGVTDRDSVEELFREFARTRDPELRETLIDANHRLVRYLAGKFANRGEPLEDRRMMSVFATDIQWTNEGDDGFELLADPQAGFDLPLKAAGTAFQRRVWQAIAAIPPGRTLTYGEIARRLKSAPRAVGQACGALFRRLAISP